MPYQLQPSIGRRRLALTTAAVAIGAVSGIVRPAVASSSYDELRHLLARTGFGGPQPAEMAKLAGLDYETAVSRLLTNTRGSALTTPPSWVNENLQQQRQEVRENRSERQQAQARVAAGAGGSPQGVQAGRPPAKGVDGKILAIPANVLQEHVRTLKNWWIEEMLVTDQPLLERMVLFWHGHFTSGFQKVKFVPALYRQNELFRHHALGNFGAMLHAVARDPAMLIYLDGVLNRVGQPNENFARELLELFTLGEGHYTEADIRAGARAFTGWSIDRESGRFHDYPALHDAGEKTFLNQTGRFGGDDIVDILLRQPRTAELIVSKLWREFISLEPPVAEVRRLAAVFRASNYEIRPLMQSLLTSAQFRDSATRGGLIKSPVELVIGTVRLLGLPVPEKTRVARLLQILGQNLFDPPNVKGWPGGVAWISTNTLMLRQQMLRRLIEATTVAPMDGGPMMRVGRRADRVEQMQPEMEPRPVEGRSLRNADGEARLGPDLAAVPPQELPRLLLPMRPLVPPSKEGSAGAVVADLLLDPTYQLK